MPNLPYENEFDSHKYKTVGGTLFHMNGSTNTNTCLDTEAKGNSEMAFTQYIGNV